MGVLRKTKSVRAVLNEFEKNSSAISVVTLVDCLSAEMNKTTVYRVLNRLENDGLLHSFLGKNGHKWYAKCNNCSSTSHDDIHPHFQCISCGKVNCLDINVHIPEIPNYKVEISQILLQGKCAECFAD